MSVQIQMRRDTAANWTAANPTLAAGEMGLETDTIKMKFGDGATAWNSLAYASGGVTSHGALTGVTANQHHNQAHAIGGADHTGSLAQANITGITTADSPQFAGVNLGHASDTTLARIAAGRVSVEGREVSVFDGIITKPTDESRTSTTALTNDADFAAALASGGVYFIEFFLIYSNAGGATADFKFALGEDSTPRGVFSALRLNASGSETDFQMQSDQTTSGAGDTASTKRLVWLRGYHVSAGGTFRLLWAQNTSNGTATKLLAGSIMKYTRIA